MYRRWLYTVDAGVKLNFKKRSFLEWQSIMEAPREDIRAIKASIRQRIWDLMERENIARFPKPVLNRIPNFQGAEAAASRLIGLPEFSKASHVKVNPDSPQRPVREAVLRLGKTLLMPTPRIREGFLLLNGKCIPAGRIAYASTIKGAFALGEKTSLGMIPKVDLIVVGSVAVSLDGSRIGKGEGYSEIEYGVLRELGLADDRTPIMTTVHDVQIVEGVPVEEHDVPVDIIVTPTRIVRTGTWHLRPRGILWNLVGEEMLREIPILRELESKSLRG